MARYLFFFLILLHGLIHLMGFVKAFRLARVEQLTQSITRLSGILWLAAGLLFVVTAVLFISGKEWWWMAAVPALVLSQVLIVLSWQDAKFGTIANALILASVVLGIGSTCFENGFRKDVRMSLARTAALPVETVTESDLLPLPAPVQRYLRVAGAVGRPKVRNMKVVFDGQMRSKGKDFFPFRSVQYNFFDEPVRLFYMKGRMYGVTVPGYHRYTDAKATMDIRLFGLFPVIRKAGEVLDTTETVTLFNDMCLMAPATLIDKRIRWEEINDTTVNAIFTNHGIAISATLFFDREGRLTNFLSNDRTEVNEIKRYPFRTPISDYQSINGVTIGTYGETIYEYPDGKFTYGKFHLRSVEYNCNSF